MMIVLICILLVRNLFLLIVKSDIYIYYFYMVYSVLFEEYYVFVFIIYDISILLLDFI